MGLAVTKQEAFWEACGFGHVKRVEAFIAQPGIDVNWVSYTHNSCAIHVASQGKKQIVKMLIDAKCKINVKDDRGNLALHHAAMKGHADIMQMLIDAGSEIDTQDKNEWSPLINAAYFCQPEAVELLVKNNCDVNLQNKEERTALHEACRSQDTDDTGLAIIACHLVEAGCDINAKSSDVGEADFTPLMFASYHGHADVAEVLAEAGCDINSQGSNGWTALHWAADRGHERVVEVLLRWNLDPLLEGRRGELAVDRAQDLKIQNLLQEVTSKAKADRLDEDGFACHSPVSTTSPASSRCSSVASLPRDESETESAIELGNSQRDVEGKATEIPGENQDVLNGNVGDEKFEVASQSTGDVDSCKAEEEKSEKDVPEKLSESSKETDSCTEISSKCEAQAEDVLINGTSCPCNPESQEVQESQPSSDTGSKNPANDTCGSQSTVDFAENQCSSSKPESKCDSSSIGEDKLCKAIDPETVESPTETTERGKENLPDESEASIVVSNSSPVESIPNSPSKSSEHSNGLESESKAPDLDASSVLHNNSTTDVPPNEGEIASDSKDTDESDFSIGSPVKINPQMKRLLAPSGGIDGASDTDDGNVSDALFNDRDYCADLADSDGDII